MKMQVGFSTGCFYKYGNVGDALHTIRSLGCSSVELGFVDLDSFLEEDLENITKEELSYFTYISFHAPKFNYGFNETTKIILDKIKRINALKSLDLVVFHPDVIDDFSVFKSMSFPIGIENMDWRKRTYQFPEDILRIVKNTKLKTVLDVNHVYTNDATMQLTKKFYEMLGKNIAEIHLSGYQGSHDPLYRTKQVEIIDAIQKFDAPIIIESIIAPEEAKNEWTYISEKLKTNMGIRHRMTIPELAGNPL